MSKCTSYHDMGNGGYCWAQKQTLPCKCGGIKEDCDFWPVKHCDAVNHPSHYNTGNIECIDAMIAAFGADEVKSFCKVNAFKYIWRADNKNGSEDISKAMWYLDKWLSLGGSENG